MKKLMIVVLLLFTGVAYGQIGVGISIGVPPPVRVEVVTPTPGADYAWVGGYWYPDGARYAWHKGYWSRPPYEGARWVGPSHDGKLYHEGYWNGNHGMIAHNHRSDKSHDRDAHHEEKKR